MGSEAGSCTARPRAHRSGCTCRQRAVAGHQPAAVPGAVAHHAAVGRPRRRLGQGVRRGRDHRGGALLGGRGAGHRSPPRPRCAGCTGASCPPCRRVQAAGDPGLSALWPASGGRAWVPVPAADWRAAAELAGAPRELIMEALLVLERSGKARRGSNCGRPGSAWVTERDPSQGVQGKCRRRRWRQVLRVRLLPSRSDFVLSHGLLQLAGCAC